MAIRLVSNEKIAETSSKGNQEKWLDSETNRWYKLDQFGYEALAETLTSRLLEKSNIEADTPFTFVRYQMERLSVHGRERNGCVSENFLKPGQSLITLNRLLSSYLGVPLSQKLGRFPSDKKRILYLAQAAAERTGLREFPQYLTLLFEIDALIANDDRHLNNIAVIEENGQFVYCPIFDHGAGLLSNVMLSQMDIEPLALLKPLRARPFQATFMRQVNAARSLTGPQLKLPKLKRAEIQEMLQPMLAYYSPRDKGIISDRVIACVLNQQKKL